jgi:non-specific serine/threonine protein kinase
VAAAKRQLSDSRLVTMTGPGGVGKTRLALKVAAEVRRAFRDGVWLVELGQLEDQALVVHTVAAALGLREQSGRPLFSALEEHLAQRQLLLVLDNCEHLLDAAAGMVDALLHSCPHLRVLVTSRELLSVDGESLFQVPSLSVPDPQRPSSPQELTRSEAVSLFVDRGVSAVPEFGLTEDNQPAVIEICHRLEGLPLAIELAAVRLRTLSPQDIADRLGDCYRLLGKGPRVAPTRQQTLRSCIEWSYNLCSSQEQRLWARLAVFSGTFSLNAAEDTCAGGDLASENVLDLVAALVDKSILTLDEHGTVVRYRMLDTIREFGRERLHYTAEDASLRRRHRDWYSRLVLQAEAEWIGPRQTEWLTLFAREHPNIRAALEFSLAERHEAGVAVRMAAALHWYWFARGVLSEGRHWLDRALAQQDGPTAGRGKALYTASRLAEVQDDLPAASAMVEEERDLAESLNDPCAAAHAMYAAGMVGLHSGDLHHAVACYSGALEVFRAHGKVDAQPETLFGVLESLWGLALTNGLLGETERAVGYHEQILAITEPRGEIWYRSFSLWALGVAVWRQGDTRQAAGLLERGLRLKRRMDEPLGTAWCLDALAWIAAEEQQAQRAATLLGAVETLSQATGAPTAPLPILIEYHERCERQTRRALGDQAFHTAFQRGRELNVEDATACALKEEPQAETTPPATVETVLTPRERQVAGLVAEGLTNKDIAARLVISQRTAEAHVEHILVKLGFTSRTQIASWAAPESAGVSESAPHPRVSRPDP